MGGRPFFVQLDDRSPVSKCVNYDRSYQQDKEPISKEGRRTGEFKSLYGSLHGGSSVTSFFFLSIGTPEKRAYKVYNSPQGGHENEGKNYWHKRGPD